MKRLAWSVLLPWLAAGAVADQPGPAPAEVLAASCYGCHGDQPGGADGFPSLTSLSREAIAGKLTAYREDRLVGTLMNRIARGYTDREIQQLAEHFGTPPR